jgi:Serine dehydrogenase proteinase
VVNITTEDALRQLQQLEPDRDHILVSHGIDRLLHQKLSFRLKTHQRFKKCTVFLTTYGGDPHAAFRIARCLRHHYTDVRLAIPSYCKSAGTLIAIVANDLAIGDLGELGPLDLQVTKPSDVMERGSGLDYMQGLQVALMHAHQAFGLFMEVRRAGLRLPTKQAGELATNMAIGMVAPLYSQIDPNRIGEMQRAIQIAKEYGERLDEYTTNLKEGALEKMVADYPSHSFVIDRKEAKKLFKRVSPMSSAEDKLIGTLWHLFGEQDDFLHVCEPVPPVVAGVNVDEAQPERQVDAQPTADAPDAPAADAAVGE